MITRRSFIRGLLAAAALAAAPALYVKEKVRKIFVGRNARLFINGKEVAYCDNVEFTINDRHTHKPVEISPVESFGPFEVHAKISPEESERLNEFFLKNS